MIKLSKVLLCIYLLCCMQHNKAHIDNETIEPYDEHVMLSELEDDFPTEHFLHEGDFLSYVPSQRMMYLKKSRYARFQNKCHDYSVMLLIYYLHIKEYWRAVYIGFKKKLKKLVSYFVYSRYYGHS